MTVGEGIFFSTILIISFASVILVTRHKRWKLVGKIAAVIILLCGSVGIGIWQYFEYKDRPYKISEYDGIKLGMRPVEVTLKKGEPDLRNETIENKEIGKFSQFFIYGPSVPNNELFYVGFSSTGNHLRVSAICAQEILAHVLGVSFGSTEKKLIERLGTTDIVSINADGTRKFLTYPKWQAAYEVVKGFVMTVCVTDSPKITYQNEFSQ